MTELIHRNEINIQTKEFYLANHQHFTSIRGQLTLPLKTPEGF